MLSRLTSVTVATIVVGACAGGAALGYGLPEPSRVVYTFSDTTLVGVEAMGQRMQIAMRGSADYGVTFSPASDAVGVTLTVERLDATIEAPLASTMRVDQTDVQGALEFTLDRFGNVTIGAIPVVSAAASRMISGATTAHTFFPALPGQSVSDGDQWVDTISYEGNDELGTTESTVLRYTVRGDTVVEGRSLVRIDLAGTSRVSNVTEMGGMDVAQSSTVEVEGHFLWDADAGLMVEMVREATGRGTVRVPIAPAPLPIEVRATQRTRLRR